MSSAPSRSFPALLALLLLPLLLALSSAQAQTVDSARTILHLLDYIAVDYPEAIEDGQVKNADEFEEMREFSRQAEALIKALPANPEHAGLLVQAQGLIDDIENKLAADSVASKANNLRWAVIRAYKVQVAPKFTPDLQRATSLYAAQCASCHGAAGKGDGLAAAGLDPAPSDFHDAPRMAQRSAYGLYNTISLGVEGTSMPPFAALSEEERWALAFFVANYPAEQDTRAQGEALWKSGQGRQAFPSLDNVATLSTNEVQEQFGAEAVAIQAYLRANPQAMAATKPTPLAFAAATLQASLDAYRQGDRVQANQLAIQAYLEGFELAEAALQHVDAKLMLGIEREMLALRGAIGANTPVAQVETKVEGLLEQLQQAQAALDDGGLSKLAVFLGALLILLREGAEAILVVAAMLAFVRRTGNTTARRWIHVGWIAALGLGALTWIISTYLVEISGASREITEGVTALIAAVMLIYVGYWLHSKSHAAAWQKLIGAQIEQSVNAGTLWSLALVSFLAVYREAFETVLFFQALSAQAGPDGAGMLFAGIAIGALGLVVIGWAILKASIKLPIAKFFSISAIVLVVLAVVFTGQGIAALQEAGKIGIDNVNFLHLPILGIFPTMQTLGAQALAIAICILVFWRTSAKRQTPSPAA